MTIQYQTEVPKLGDLIVFVREDASESVYYISAPYASGKKVALTNFTLGVSNYLADSIEQLIEVYLRTNNSGSSLEMNPIVEYYFVSSEALLSPKPPLRSSGFGYVNI